jgi:uncharacterized membrane protein
MVSLKNWRRRLANAFWLLPSALTLARLLLGVVLVEVDRSAGDHGIDFAYSGGAAAARSILSSLAGSLITVAGLTFSIVIVTLQLASSQYSPHILGTFLGDRLTQLLAGASWASSGTRSSCSARCGAAVRDCEPRSRRSPSRSRSCWAWPLSGC